MFKKNKKNKLFYLKLKNQGTSILHSEQPVNFKHNPFKQPKADQVS